MSCNLNAILNIHPLLKGSNLSDNQLHVLNPMGNTKHKIAALLISGRKALRGTVTCKRETKAEMVADFG